MDLAFVPVNKNAKAELGQKSSYLYFEHGQ